MNENIPGMTFVYLRLADVLRVTGIGCKGTLYKLMKRQEHPFPQPDRFGIRDSRWRSDLVGQWMQQQSELAQSRRGELDQRYRAKGAELAEARRAAAARKAAGR